MPYIKEEERELLEDWLYDLLETLPNTSHNAGVLNYLFTRIAHDYIEKQGLNYQHINDVVGALDGAKSEFYRRVAIPYEDKKIIENGDVIPDTSDHEELFKEIFTFKSKYEEK